MYDDNDVHSMLNIYGRKMGREVKYDALDRENVISIIDAAMVRPILKNICLIADPGMGKTHIVEYWAKLRSDTTKTYELDIGSMGSEGQNMFVKRLTDLVLEVEEINKLNEDTIVLFIDELHVLGRNEYSMALEILKPPMQKGIIRLIGATTKEEYTKYIEKNAALIDRFEMYELRPLSNEAIFKILENIWNKELPDYEPVNEHLLNKIIEYGKYKPSQSQPRKAIKMLDDLIGWYRAEDVVLNEALLDRRIYDTLGVDPKFRVDINQIEKTMRDRVFGQDLAITTLVDSLNVSVAGLNDPTRPESYIFLGPTGVGKTEIAKAMGQGLFGDEVYLDRYDMSEYQTEADVEKFIYKVSDSVGKNAFGVRLFDEIEKAHRGVMDLFLQILDDGRLEDRYGRQVYFSNCYIIFTTNIGHEAFERARTTSTDMTNNVDLAQDMLQRADAFRPELVNRMNGVIPFNDLDRNTRDLIAQKRLEELKTKLKTEKNIDFDYDEMVIRFITREVSDEKTTAGGGRDINKKVVKHIAVPVSKLINRYKEKLVSIEICIMGKLRMGEKQNNVSEARIAIKRFEIKDEDGNTHIYSGDVSEEIEAIDDGANHEIIKKDVKKDDYYTIFENVY
ncbi:TPA: ATP-dependent Clp protease ATP-binding subunit [Staphylococcus aureus]|nr:ATP-dependent Clp protease ATP-binding subunit [Staphylococcus aureus]HDJ3113236.1 ATP-dependent Clp protease ATP-binding subunit [Staphylococcus aureus]